MKIFNKETTPFEDWDAGWQLIAILLSIIILIVAVFLIISLIGMPFDYMTCMKYKIMGIDVQWNFLTSCMANHPKFGWMPIDRYFNTFNIYSPK